ncbi:hypothetical protein BCY91_12695 [Pelobium manganitolerans]|uniref:Uncharacterized protein n=1 Tax=Pelobium manganitolerans TaxID=1842495 RepID=A0A419S1Y1_9SPHI|nr:hypothetical protein [Pelobium manganitolerans]RKD12496.1 hypothetical protein BCY91_12695 [Pelobium manganitolerans]
MAKSIGNVVTTGFSGLIGKLLVFRQRAGKTFVGDRPVKSSKAPTDKMLEVRAKFKKAIVYAKAVIRVDDELSAAYAAKANKGQSGFNLAFADYMKAPVFLEMPEFPEYTGKKDESLSVMVTDDFKVASVHFTIQDAGGAVLESGEATGIEDSPLWVYQTTAAHASVSGATIKIVAKDLPGNATTEEVTLL